MTKLTTIIFGDIKERLVIKNIRATDFANRLQGHVDNNKKGFLSNSKSEFFGTVSKNNFKLRTNKILKSEDFGVYGEFHEDNENLTVDIEYSKSLLEKLLPIGLTIVIIYLTVNSISDKTGNVGLLLFLIIFLIGFVIVSHISKTNEKEKISRTIRDIFEDKEIVNAR